MDDRCPVGGNPVEQYLIHSYIYYVLDDSIISDHLYDALCHWMYHHYEELVSEHLHLVDKDALKAGTGHHLMYLFPEDIKQKAHDLLRQEGRRS